jgi:hypothetical protein
MPGVLQKRGNDAQPQHGRVGARVVSNHRVAVCVYICGAALEHARWPCRYVATRRRGNAIERARVARHENSNVCCCSAPLIGVTPLNPLEFQ